MHKPMSFRERMEENTEQLDLYTTAITRAHGETHPEAFRVRRLYEEISTRVHATDTDKPNLDAAFIQLRKTTNNYEVPVDVCGTYAAVYNMLSEADRAYQFE